MSRPASGTSTTTGTTTTDPWAGDDKRERVAERLRALRGRLDGPQTDPDAFELDLYGYDESLIVAADLLDVEVPKGARDEMSAEQRQVLEDRLKEAGLDVRR